MSLKDPAFTNFISTSRYQETLAHMQDPAYPWATKLSVKFPIMNPVVSVKALTLAESHGMQSGPIPVVLRLMHWLVLTSMSQAQVLLDFGDLNELSSIVYGMTRLSRLHECQMEDHAPNSHS